MAGEIHSFVTKIEKIELSPGTGLERRTQI